MNAYSPTLVKGGSPDGFGLETPCKQPKEFELHAKKVTPYLELVTVDVPHQYPSPFNSEPPVQVQLTSLPDNHTAEDQTSHPILSSRQ